MLRDLQRGSRSECVQSARLIALGKQSLACGESDQASCTVPRRHQLAETQRTRSTTDARWRLQGQERPHRISRIVSAVTSENGERGRNRTFSLLIKSWFSPTWLMAASEPININQRLIFTKARTEAFGRSSEKGRIGAFGSMRTAHSRHTYR
jgi:hypothetical protein